MPAVTLISEGPGTGTCYARVGNEKFCAVPNAIQSFSALLLPPLSGFETNLEHEVLV